MKDFTNSDATHIELKRHLAITEQLLALAASEESGCEQEAELWLMPDLGLPHSVSRMIDGFYTGAVYRWQTRVPIVPVGATVNVCSVAVFRTHCDVTSATEFTQRIERANRRAERNSSYHWNFDSGNHFITYGEVELGQQVPPGRYLVLHSSACEFKTQDNGLYPTEGNWFYSKIRRVDQPKGCRFLRYIVGRDAERFFRQARLLEDFNRLRLQYFAQLILGSNQLDEELFCHPHYGMPDLNTVAIGCQWLQGAVPFLLLTAPNLPLFFVKPSLEGTNRLTLDGREYILQPHGMGLRGRNGLRLTYEDESLVFNGHSYTRGASLKGSPDVRIREPQNARWLTDDFLRHCPGDILATLEPIFSYP